MAGTLKVLIVGAENLDRLVTVGEQQPYYLLEYGQQRSRSKPCIQDGCNPMWNTAHKFYIADGSPILAVIKDAVAKGVLGETAIDHTRAQRLGKDEGTVQLTNLAGKPAGLLRYKLKFSAGPDGAATLAATSAVRQPSVPPDTGSHALTARDNSQYTTAAVPATVISDNDPMHKVLLAKAAMQQLTAELAELTRGPRPAPQAESAATAATTARQADNSCKPGHFQQRQFAETSGSIRSQHTDMSRQNSSQSRRSVDIQSPQRQSSSQSRRRSVEVLPPACASPGALSPDLPPGMSASSNSGYKVWQSDSFSHRNIDSRVSSMVAPSTEELLAMYSSGGPIEQQQVVLPHGLTSSHSQLVQQLQEALTAAHAEKVAAEEECVGVKQAMAAMSRQHFLDIKRLRDVSGTTGAALGGASWSPGSTSPAQHSIRAMVDSNIHKTTRRPRVSQDSSEIEQQQQQQSPAASGNGQLHDEDSSPLPAYKLRIQVHQLERQRAEEAAKTREALAARDQQAAEAKQLREQLESLTASLQQSQAAIKAAEGRAAEQATLAAATQAQAAVGNVKEAQLLAELSDVKSVLSSALADKAELEEALGLMEKNNSAQVAALQAELTKLHEEVGVLRQGNIEMAALQAQLTAAREEASGLRSNNDEVEYLQAQLRRTLRQVVELQHQVSCLQSC
eukprot:GHRR01003645.1.p1 GENE.GHRR01003645.1~~GHRR01003645.1.p1  ORF type:complete len:678 (+),score=311.46 GHRR01003645.1:524-2557(+)